MPTSAEIHIDDGTRAQQNKTVIIISYATELLMIKNVLRQLYYYDASPKSKSK